MARPSTPKLPVSKTLVSEVLQRVSNAKTKAQKVEILQEYKSPALTKVLLCNFAKTISFVFPSGKTPYTKLDRPKGVEHQMLFTEQRLLDKFITKTVNGVTYYGCSGSTKPNLQQIKKEKRTLFEQSEAVTNRPKNYAAEPDQAPLAATDPIVQAMSAADLDKLLAKTKRDMERAAKAMEFMEAARLRDELHALEARRKEVGK